MTKILNLKKPRDRIAQTYLSLRMKESYTELMCRILGEYWPIRNAIMQSDHDTVIEKVEKLAEGLELWLVPIRNKVQGVKNRKYRNRKAKVTKIHANH